MSMFKNPRARLLALALGVAVVGPLATAAPSFAAFGTSPQQPKNGANCQASDGKISGRGSTFQENLENEYINEYTQDVCGPVGAAGNLVAGYGLGEAGAADPAGSNMITYNYVPDGNLTGSGQGRNSANCRTDFFGGSDTPYTSGQLGSSSTANTLDGPAAGSGDGCKGLPSGSPNVNAISPYFAEPAGGYGSGDATDNIMALPIGGGPVAISVNLTNNSDAGAGSAAVDTKVPNGGYTAATDSCGTITQSGSTFTCSGSGPTVTFSQGGVGGSTAGVTCNAASSPTSLDLTGAEVDAIFQGTINQWNSPTLVANNPQLATDNCGGNITRVVRQDNSGTTQNVMEYLNFQDSATLCDGTGTWGSLWGNSTDTVWPSGCSESDTGTTANPVVASLENGTNAQAALLALVPGGIAYGEAGDYTGTIDGAAWAPAINYGGFAAGATTIVPGWQIPSQETQYGLGPNTTFNPVLADLQPNGASTGTYAALTTSNGATNECNMNANGLPVATAQGSVGLGATTWAASSTLTTPPNKPDIIQNQNSTSYPLCGLTFNLVYTHANAISTSSTTSNTTGPEVGWTADQVRTEYSYYTYMFTPAAQVGLNLAGYDQIPASWLSQIRAGFQYDF
ncbi:MAG: substrate-binding domain-containing protein [Solirubrobacteraceae bacterium]